jgi:hypothetical protein
MLCSVRTGLAQFEELLHRATSIMYDLVTKESRANHALNRPLSHLAVLLSFRTKILKKRQNKWEADVRYND